jgi:septal ring factor EnvC (AmiA/AmiB activator)
MTDQSLTEENVVQAELPTEVALTKEQVEVVVQLNNDVMQIKMKLADLTLEEGDFKKALNDLETRKSAALEEFAKRAKNAQEKLTALAVECGVPAETESWSFDFSTMSFKKA